MSVQDKFDQPLAYDPNGGETGEGALVAGAVFTVHAVDDLAFTTPLGVFDPASGAAIATLRSSSIGVLPQFAVVGSPAEVLLKSEGFVTRLQSRFGVMTEAGWTPDAAAVAGEAATVAVAARDEAVQAAGEAGGAATAAVVAANIPGQVEAGITSSPTVTAMVTAAAGPAIDAEIEGRSIVESSDERLPQVGSADPLTEAWTNADDELVFGVDVPRGVVEAPVVESQRTNTVELVAGSINGVREIQVTEESGLSYGLMDKDELLWEPTLVDLDGRHPQWVLDRMAARMNIPGATGYKTPYGPDQTRIRKFVSGPDIVTWGTSMGAGAGGGGHTIGSEIAALTGLTHRNGSVGGENTTGIGARNGSNPFLFILAGGELPESGPVAVTWRTDGAGPNAWPFLQGSGTGENAVAGVAGTLHLRQLDGTVVPVPGKFSWVQDPVHKAATDGRQWQHSGNDVYYFTRDTPGAVVPAPRPSAFLYAFGEARAGDINLFWAIRNNNLQSPEARQIAYDFHERSIAKMAAINPRFLIFGEALGGSFPTGEHTPLDPNLVAGDLAYNAYMQSRWGRHFIDTHKNLVEFGLSDFGLTPTADDTWDMANNRVPRSLRIDATHFNQYGYRATGRLGATRMREFGWVS